MNITTEQLELLAKVAGKEPRKSPNDIGIVQIYSEKLGYWTRWNPPKSHDDVALVVKGLNPMQYILLMDKLVELYNKGKGKIYSPNPGLKSMIAVWALQLPPETSTKLLLEVIEK